MFEGNDRAWKIGIELASLDLGAMRRAARVLTGTRDFAAFRSRSCRFKTTVRTIEALEVIYHEGESPRWSSGGGSRGGGGGGMIEVRVHGTSFLHNQVRRMVGSLVAVGTGQKSVADVEWLLSRRSCTGVSGGSSHAPRIAPPHGLYLAKVHYALCAGGCSPEGTLGSCAATGLCAREFEGAGGTHSVRTLLSRPKSRL